MQGEFLAEVRVLRQDKKNGRSTVPASGPQTRAQASGSTMTLLAPGARQGCTPIIPPSIGGSPLTTGVEIPAQALLLADKSQKPRKAHLLHRLGRRPVHLPGHVIPRRVGVDTELDRFTGFIRIGFRFSVRGLSGWRVSPPPDNPMPSFSKAACRGIPEEAFIGRQGEFRIGVELELGRLAQGNCGEVSSRPCEETLPRWAAGSSAGAGCVGGGCVAKDPGGDVGGS